MEDGDIIDANLEQVSSVKFYDALRTQTDVAALSAGGWIHGIITRSQRRTCFNTCMSVSLLFAASSFLGYVVFVSASITALTNIVCDVRVTDAS